MAINNGFQPTNRGVVFHEDSAKLFVFAQNSVTVAVGYPNPQAWQKTSAQPYWHHVRPSIHIRPGALHGKIEKHKGGIEDTPQLQLPFSTTRGKSYVGDLALLSWSNLQPLHLRNLISHYQNRHWHLLSFLSRCGEPAYDLAMANPALAYALASNWAFHQPAVQRPLRSARALLKHGKSQRQILKWLGFPDSEASRKVLRKVVPRSVTVPALLYLRQAMRDPEVMKILCHISRLNAGVLRIITDPALRPHVTPTFIEQTAATKHEDKKVSTAYLLEDAIRMHGIVGPTGRRFPLMSDRSALCSLHASLVKDMKYIRLRDRYPDLIHFPPPPVPGTENIVPITSPEELVREGLEQENCVTSYFPDITIVQTHFVYRVFHPERCTLSLEKMDDEWKISQLAGKRNKEASKETWRLVNEWFVAGGSQQETIDPHSETDL